MNNIPDYSASQEADNSVRVDSSQTSSKLDAKIGKICRAGFICSVAASIITLSVIVFFAIRFNDASIPGYWSTVALVFYAIAWAITIAGVIISRIGLSMARKAKMKRPALGHAGKVISTITLVVLIVVTVIFLVIVWIAAMALGRLISNIEIKPPEEQPYYVDYGAVSTIARYLFFRLGAWIGLTIIL